MSYAGPVSRAKRAPGAAPNRAAEARKSASLGVLPGRRGTGQAARTGKTGYAASYSDDHRPTLIFAAGILVGMAVGAGVALMLAPQSGADTRRALRRKGRRAVHRGRDAWDDLRDELRDAMRRRRHARHRDQELDDDAVA